MKGKKRMQAEINYKVREHRFDIASKTALKKIYKNGVLVYTKHCTFEQWYDKNGNIIHHKDKDGERWHEYDERGNVVHSIWHLGCKGDHEVWREYDAAGNEIHNRDDRGYEQWYKYDADGNVVHYKNSNGVEGRYDRDENKLHFKFGEDEEWQGYAARGNDRV